MPPFTGLTQLICIYRTANPYSMVSLRARSIFVSKRLASKDGITWHAKRSTKKKRLDELCVERYPQYSRSLIQSWILQGKVLVDGKPADKAGTSVSEGQDINLIAEVPKYVCRAGYKLEAALEHFAADVQGKVALDAGLSTGGFSDCLLQYGASHIYGVDVGYGQVAEKIRTDTRVVVMERTNLRYLPALPQLVDLATLDLSFISILLVLPAVLAVMKSDATLFTLIKPQFEARRNQVGGGGVVRDAEVHKEVLDRVISGATSMGLRCEGWIESPLKGADGNIEFLACFHRGSGGTVSQSTDRRAYAAIYEDFDVFKGTAEAAHRVRVDGYDETGFQVNGTSYTGSVVCLSSLHLSWSPKTFEEINPESLSLFELLRPAPEILILGCGKHVRLVGQDVKDYLRQNGMRVEAVDSRNGASTFNFLNEEGRQVAAALLPTSA